MGQNTNVAGIDVFSVKKGKRMTIPTVKDTFQKKTSSAPLVCPNLKQKDLSSYSCTYMQRRKHVQLDLRVSLFRAEPGTTVKKGIDTERKEQQ